IKLLHEHNVKVVVTSVPHFPQYSGRWSSKPHKIVEDTVEKNNAIYLNSYELLKKQISPTDQSKYYFDDDPTHFNEGGNMIWAQAQVKFLLTPKYKLFN